MYLDCINFIYFEYLKTLILCSCFYGEQEPEREEEQMRVDLDNKIWLSSAPGSIASRLTPRYVALRY